MGRRVAAELCVGFCLLCLGAGPKIAFTEIMYDPTSSESDDQQTEWVEIHNFGDEAVNLKGYQLTSGSRAKPHDAKQRFVIGDVTVAAGAYFVFGIGNKAAYDGLGLPDFDVYVGEEQYAWLTNDGDSIAIRDARGKVVDEVVYKAESPWPIISGSGSSLQFIAPSGEDPTVANDRAENWVASNSTNARNFPKHGRGTPGGPPGKATTQPSHTRTAKRK